MANPTPTRIRVARLSPSDAQALAEFFNVAWNAPLGADAVERAEAAIRNEGPFRQEIPAPTVAVFDKGRMVGHLTTIPTEIAHGSELTPAVWFKGFMVLPEYRNGPVGFLLAKELVKHVDVAMVVTVTDSARRLFEAVGFGRSGMLPNYVSLIAPSRFLRSLDVSRLGLASIPKPVQLLLKACRFKPVAGLAGLFVRTANTVSDAAHWMRGGNVNVEVSRQLPDENCLDELWSKMRSSVAFCPTRSGAYLKWRYARNSTSGYEFLIARRANRLVGLAVVRLPRRLDDPRLSGLLVGQVVDMLVEPSAQGAAGALLIAARRWAKSAGCDALLLTATHKLLTRRMRSHLYVRIPSNIHFLVRSGATAISLPADAGEHWVMRGDAWGDDI